MKKKIDFFKDTFLNKNYIKISIHHTTNTANDKMIDTRNTAYDNNHNVENTLKSLVNKIPGCEMMHANELNMFRPKRAVFHKSTGVLDLFDVLILHPIQLFEPHSEQWYVEHELHYPEQINDGASCVTVMINYRKMTGELVVRNNKQHITLHKSFSLFSYFSI